MSTPLTVNVNIVAVGQLPDTDRWVLGWGRHSQPKMVYFRSKIGIFTFSKASSGATSTEYWILPEELYPEPPGWHPPGPRGR